MTTIVLQLAGFLLGFMPCLLGGFVVTRTVLWRAEARRCRVWWERVKGA